MKTHQLSIHRRIWIGGVLAAALGLSGLTLRADPPANSSKDAADSQSPGNSQQNWDDQVFERMRHMQQEMDSLFRSSMSDIDSTADKAFDTGPKFDASASVQDRGDHYEASFYLPKRDLSSVKVNVKDGMLSVDASSEQTTKTNSDKNSEESEMLSQYQQIVSLPGPVDAGKMQVKKEGDSIVVTIPKKDNATASTK